MKKSHATTATFPPVPLGLARSALFGVSRPGGAEIVQRSIAIAPLRGSRLLYSGPQLCQHHALLWQAVLQAAAEQGTTDDQPLTIAADSLLRAMGGKGNDSEQRARVWRWLKDLTAARIEYSTITHDYAGPLVFEVLRLKPSGLLSVRLNPTLHHLIGDEVLRNDLARKARLGRNLLALWLHDYIGTHLRPPPEPVAMLRNLCGSPLALPQFRQRLRAALDLLTRGDDALVLSWSIDRRDRLIIEKRPTRVVILPPQAAQAKQAAAQHHGRKQAEVDRARQQRARLAL
jgi:hypothetical protein